MKYEVKCEDYFNWIETDGKNKTRRTLHITVMISDESKEVEFYQCLQYGGFATFPIKEWAKIKDIVDRLIIQAEKLAKDC